MVTIINAWANFVVTQWRYLNSSLDHIIVIRATRRLCWRRVNMLSWGIHWKMYSPTIKRNVIRCLHKWPAGSFFMGGQSLVSCVALVNSDMLFPLGLHLSSSHCKAVFCVSFRTCFCLGFSVQDIIFCSLHSLHSLALDLPLFQTQLQSCSPDQFLVKLYLTNILVYHTAQVALGQLR